MINYINSYQPMLNKVINQTKVGSHMHQDNTINKYTIKS